MAILFSSLCAFCVIGAFWIKSFSFAARTSVLLFCALLLANPTSTPQEAASRFYLGFDRNDYPGDDAMTLLRKDFAFTSYWLSPPPGEKTNTWFGKRDFLRSLDFGFLVLFRGPKSSELRPFPRGIDYNFGIKRGIQDARGAAAAANKEGFPAHTVIFLDIEEGGRLPAVYYAYLRDWTDQLTQAGYRAGVYCSGMRVSEGRGATIITADDIRSHIGARELVYWVYNDACPPSPGCTFEQNPPAPVRSGISYAAVWQFAQSPRRKEYTARCAKTYHRDGNCYSPADTTHKWFLDVNSATSPDPSGGPK